MITTIICLLAFVISVILVEFLVRKYDEAIVRISYMFTWIFLIPLIIIANVKMTERLQFEKQNYERQQLIEEYENGNQFAYDDIIAFDKDLKDYKFWGQNPLTNWFYNQSIVNDLDYILYDGE